MFCVPTKSYTECNRLNITNSSMSEYYQSPITMSEFTTSYITNGLKNHQSTSYTTNEFRNHQSTSYITNGFKNHQSTYKVNKKAQFPQYIHQTCFFLALWILMVSRWTRRKYGVLSSAKSRGMYGMSKEGILSNWLYSSSSTTFSTPTILFFPGITTYQFFFARSGT